MFNIKLGNIFKPFNKPLAQQKLLVSYESEFVTLNFGGTTITVHYQDALKIGALIMHKAKQCKRKCGDISRHLIAHGE